VPRDLTLLVWGDIKSGDPNQGNLVTAPWVDWVSVLSTHVRRSTKGGPCVVCGHIPKGKPRLQIHVEATDTVCLDIDKGTTEEIGEILEAFAPYEYVAYTSFSHARYQLGTKDTPPAPGEPTQTKLRVLLPLARRVSAKEYEGVWPVIQQLAKHPIDKAIKALNQGYYLPSARVGAPTLAHHNKTGRWLDPDNLLQLSDTPAETSTELPTVEVLGRVETIIRKLAKMIRSHPLKAAANALINGEPLDFGDGRHDTIIRLTGWIAFKTENKPLHPSVIEALFQRSIDAMRLDRPHDMASVTIDAATAAYETAIAKAIEIKEAERKEAQSHYAGPESPEWPKETLERCAEAQESTVEQLAFVVVRDRAHYILQPDTYFCGPFTEKDAFIEIIQALGRSPVELYEVTNSGNYKPRPFFELIRRYGRVAQQVVANLATQRTYYDREHRTIHEAVCPRRTFEPVHNPKIDHWLRLFAGTPANYEKLLDWMACCPDLNKLLCALTLAGAPGTGKTLFAQGMASLWAEGGAAASPEVILGNFNEDLTRCPLVFADETLPKTYRWESVTTKLRAEIASLVRTLNRKYYAPLTLQGSLRFILATNNPMILASNISTAADLNAVAVRFLYLETGAEAEQYLLTLDHETKDGWRIHQIAAHALWLQQNRAVTPAGRFWVTGDLEKMHRLLVTSSDWNSWVCEWIVKGLLDGYRKAEQNQDTVGRVIVQEGHLFVNISAVADGWPIYTNYPNIPPDPRKIATALRSISLQPKAVQVRTPGGTRHRYFDIDLNHLVAWADEKGICGAPEIELAIHQGITERPKIVNLNEHRNKGKDQPQQ